MPPTPPRPGAAPAARPGAAPAALGAAAPTDVQPAADLGPGSLNDDNALTRWRFPISTRFGAIVVTLFTDRNTPTGEPAPIDATALGGAAARVVGALLGRNWSAARTAAGDMMHSAADVVGHLHVGLHWKPAKAPLSPSPDAPPVTSQGENPVATPAVKG